MITLSNEQEQALETISLWLTEKDKKEFKLGGYAGTGKTTLLKQFDENLMEEPAIAAFTGKAVSVLKKKGLTSAQTLHSLIYDCEPLKGGGVAFHRKTKLEGNPSLIIVDEASMLSTELYNDLKTFNKKILFVGDPGQLEPVGENPNLMRAPDLTLETIHRQAAQSPIIALANGVRLGDQIIAGRTDEELVIRTKAGFDMRKAMEFDQVICARNATRTSINRKFRNAQGRGEKELYVGDKLIVHRNNSYWGVFNGLILFVTEIVKDNENHWVVNAKDEVEAKYHNLPIWKFPFQVDEMPKEFTIPKMPSNDNPQMVYAVFAYCITCHKAQGSEWNKIVVWDEPISRWDMARWRYTAITRASQHLTYCL